MSALLTGKGEAASNEALAGICDWILDDGVLHLCPEGMRCLALGVRRLLAEAAASPAAAAGGAETKQP